MSAPHNDNYSILPHTHEPRILLIQETGGWMLPQHSENDALAINTAMKEQFGLETTVLYCAYDRYKDDEREDSHRVYALENHSPDWTPATPQAWVDLATLQELELLVPEHRALLEHYLTHYGHDDERRLPWARFGWFESATIWIQQQLNTHGYVASHPIEQMLVSAWSTILCVPATKGNLYFKASDSMFAAYEPVLTQTLAHLIPTHLPPVLAIDAEQCWMLMRDAGTPLAAIHQDDPEPARWEEALGLFAQVQIDLIDHVSTLEHTSIPDMRLKRLPFLFEEALTAKDMLLLGQEDGMPEDDYTQLLAFVPQLRAMCEELAQYHIPESLHHDDFHGNNILDNGETYVFFDWAECALTHPFCSMMVILRVAKYVLEYDEAQLARFRDAYLAPWTRYEPIERLREAFALAVRIGTLCRALTWKRFISNVEPSAKWEYEGSFPYFLRVFLGTEE